MFTWSSIVQSLRERRTVPVLGGDAVRFTWGGRTAPLHEFIATLLGARLRENGEPLPDPAPAGLTAFVRAVTALPQNAERDLNLLKRVLHTLVLEIHRELLPQVEPARESESLRILKDAPVFVTTAIDAGPELVLKALGLKPTAFNVKRLTARTAEDLPDDWAGCGTTPFYYMFGRIEGDMTFALTDDEIIENFLKLQGAEPPRRLIEAFADKDVLVLGTGFPDWLLRFALRWTHGRAYADRPLDSFTLVAEDRLREDHPSPDAELLGFLRQFPSGTWLYRDAHPVEFLARLAAHAEAGSATASLDGSRSVLDAQAPPPGGHVFISYASEDQGFARRLAEALGRRCRVWVDEQRLRGGEELHPKLQAAIEEAHLVVPLISRHTNAAAGRRVFVEEWKCALRWAAGIQIGLRPFLVPVVIDDLPLSKLAGEATKFADLTFRYARPRSADDAVTAFEHLVDDLHAQYQKVESVLHGLPAAS